MTVDELLIREKANALHEIDKQELMTNFAFINATVNGSDKNGNPLVKKPTDIADYDKLRNQITGEHKNDDSKKVNKYKKLSDRAKRAREEAIKELKKGG
ncbi:hypothetical protein FFIC_241060 [Fructobacillus ficulneus]|uniref:Uncharacterized protein n=2 Tax=Fructobacillus ficulneus TaxID=157463 RepID=A0A0K8MGZ0_9LACO|nr:hypothetical protein FFIC_241060 [Fructobacillus ficulneus]